TTRAGLRALLARSCEHAEAPTARDLAFAIAPRINAAGRIDEAELAISLLLETDPEAAERTIEALEEVHRRRRELTAAAVLTARGLVGDGDATHPLAIRDDTWAAGIVGLVAGRLAEDLARPVAAAVLVGDEVRGSVRAPADFHVAAALEACGALLTKRGGHAGAGGFSARPQDWEAFVAAFAAVSRPFPADPARLAERPGRLSVDLVLPAAYLGWGLAAELDRLAPFGPGHPEPLLAVTGLKVREARRVGNAGDHLSLRLLRGAETFDAIAFGTPTDRPLPDPGLDLDVVGTLERDTFQGAPRLRIRALDYAAAAASPLAGRRGSARRVALPVTEALVAR
ncbi:MAG: DHHA1 domain-containing protein, partial [Candidatus Limnocylindria bacterium]